MKKEIAIPEKVEVNVEGKKVVVKGEKGELVRDFSDPRYNKTITIEKTDSSIVIATDEKKRRITTKMINTIAAHIKNMIRGVQQSFEYKLKIHYVHFPITVEVKDGKVLVKNFLGEKGARVAKIVADTSVKIEKDTIVVSSANIEHAGQTAANIEQACRVGSKDRRVFQDGIFITEKPQRAYKSHEEKVS